MASSSSGRSDLERIRRLARQVADGDQGPAGELACALAETVTEVAARVDALWQLITEVVESAGLAAAGPAAAASSAPPPEFLQAATSPRASGVRGLRLSIDSREWVAAISQDQPPADPARAWAALERLTRTIDDDS